MLFFNRIQNFFILFILPAFGDFFYNTAFAEFFIILFEYYNMGR